MTLALTQTDKLSSPVVSVHGESRTLLARSMESDQVQATAFVCPVVL